MHDAWAPYDCYPATHALCNAHLLRELVAVTETTTPREDGWCWAVQVIDALLELKTLVDKAVTANQTGIDPLCLERLTGRVRSAAQIAVNTTHHRRDKIAAKHHALARQILDRHHIT